MKAIIFLIFCVLSLSLFASDGGFVTDKENFNNLMSVEKTEKSLYPWQYSNTSCYAFTRCPNGRTVSCRTFGFAYSAMPAHLSNSCSFASIWIEIGFSWT